MTNNDENEVPSKKGYVMALLKPTKPDFEKYDQMVGPTVAPFGGKLIVKQSISKDAVYMESPAEQFQTVVVVQFPSLIKAQEWYTSVEYSKAKQLRMDTAVSLLSILEGDDLSSHHGFLATFMTVKDADKFAQYKPGPSLASFGASRVVAKLDNDAKKTYAEADGYDVSVLLGFPTRKTALEWMQSDIYAPAKEVRLSSSQGPVVIFGMD